MVLGIYQMSYMTICTGISIWGWIKYNGGNDIYGKISMGICGMFMGIGLSIWTTPISPYILDKSFVDKNSDFYLL